MSETTKQIFRPTEKLQNKTFFHGETFLKILKQEHSATDNELEKMEKVIEVCNFSHVYNADRSVKMLYNWLFVALNDLKNKFFLSCDSIGLLMWCIWTAEEKFGLKQTTLLKRIFDIYENVPNDKLKPTKKK